MASSNRAPRDETAASTPLYVQGGRADELWAHFRSGAVVQATRGRVRHYPGLSGTAPSTIAYYIRGTEVCHTTTHVVDAGCGAGEGLRHLSRSCRRVTGIDKDGRALAFAHQIAKDVALQQADLQLPASGCAPAQAAYFIDVLGHLERPERALQRVVELLTEPKALVVAEPRASAAQQLVAPVRRAFSERGLYATLLRGGFIVEQWVSTDGPFIQVQAVAHRDPSYLLLAQAESRFETGDFAAALELTTLATNTSLSGLRLEALLAKARTLIELQRRDAATAVLLEARELDLTDSRPVAALAQLAVLAGGDQNALVLAKEAVQLDLLEVSGICALGAMSREARPQAALDAWLVAHALAPDHAGIVAQVCEAALAVDNYAIAVTVLDRYRHYQTNGVAAHHSVAMAWLLARAGRPLEARLEARLAEARAPDAPELAQLWAFLRELQESATCSD